MPELVWERQKVKRGMEQLVSVEIEQAVDRLNGMLLARRNENGWWTGRLSTSALSTATAVMALLKALENSDHHPERISEDQRQHWQTMIDGGLAWLADHQNSDGGWGDTVLSISNISTTMLCYAVLRAFHRRCSHREQNTATDNRGLTNHASRDDVPFCSQGEQRLWSAMESSGRYVERAGGVAAVVRRYGKDRTFSVPILTHCALAGIVDWKDVIPLPFELSCVPHQLYAAVKMPVVSYALPALIAIGQVIFRHQGHWNPVLRFLRQKSIAPSLRVLESIQPPNGGFLEATPLTSFVCMSLLGCGLSDHVVTQRCLKFIEASVRDDGSWPIDTNLTTWVTTLSVNALSGMERAGADSGGRAGSELSFDPALILNWLQKQQYRTIHPYTHAAPGGWSWTDLPGGVPDADDTPGAMLAVMNLRLLESQRGSSASGSSGSVSPGVDESGRQTVVSCLTNSEKSSLQAAAIWLLDLQNRDGGWPTFCRGWGTLPFDRSSCDLTAHALRALSGWLKVVPEIPSELRSKAKKSMNRGIRFLKNVQRPDGTWLPLWFGHQFNHDDENPLYGTSRVVRALSTIGEEASDCCRKAVLWLLENQNEDGGWSARRGLESSVEETGLALDSLTDFAVDSFFPNARAAIDRAAGWLAKRVNAGTVDQPSPIGFYFARLWYFEELYPIIFAAAGLNRWRAVTRNDPSRDRSSFMLLPEI
ncbi:MAG: prenyltransferase/squalene oxidase repeat-containing protein [Planctomycetota bacterium]